jgi:type II secretory pathway pseudopilin PulG
MKNKHSHGFGLPEAIVLTVLVAIAAALILPAFARPRRSNPRISCVNREKQLGIAFRGFAIDAGAFPMQVPATNALVNPPAL